MVMHVHAPQRLLLRVAIGCSAVNRTLNGEVRIHGISGDGPTVAGKMTIKMLRASDPGAAKTVKAAMVRARLQPRLKV